MNIMRRLRRRHGRSTTSGLRLVHAGRAPYGDLFDVYDGREAILHGASALAALRTLEERGHVPVAIAETLHESMRADSARSSRYQHRAQRAARKVHREMTR